VKLETPLNGFGDGRFLTTRWSVVLSCSDSASDEDKAETALAELCKIYWRPVFAFICRQGHSIPDAQDFTQEFFGRVIKGRLIQSADRSKGRFRSLLLKALQRFLHDEGDKRHARKRGGDLSFVSWDDWMTEAPTHLSIPGPESDNWSPERIFDVRWAATVVEQALRRLAEECERRGRLRMFTVLSKYLSVERVEISYANLSTSLGVPESVIKRVLHQLRVRYRGILREEVAQTVANPAEVDDEIRYLCAVLASAR